MALLLRILAAFLVTGSTLSRPVTFTAGPATSAQSSLAASPNSLVADGAAASTLTLTLRDAYGNLVSNANATLSITGSANALSPNAVTTNTFGQATAVIRSTKAEMKTVTASNGAFSVSTQISFIAGSPNTTMSTLVINPSTGTIANNANTALATATINDAFGNPVANQTVNFAASGTSTSLSPLSGSTSASGVSTTSIKTPQAQTQTITSTGGPAVNTASVTFVAGPAVDIKSSFVASRSSIYANGTQPSLLTMTARDANNNACVGQLVSFSATGGNNTFSPASMALGAGGAGSSSMTTTQAQTQTVTATVGSVALTTTIVSTGPVAAAQSSFVASPNSALASNGNVVSALVLTARDSSGRPLANQAVSFNTSDFKTSINPNIGVTSASGVLSATVSSVFSGTHTYTASLGPSALKTTATFSTKTSNCAATPIFTQYPGAASTGAQAVYLADINGDGNQDIVSALQRNGVGINLGRGNGTFGPLITLSSNYVPIHVVVADLNGDGNQDIVASYINDAVFGIYMGTGGGNFNAVVNYSPASIHVRDIVAIDINGDSKLDLVFAGQQNPGALVTALGNGDGTFQAGRVFYSGGITPVSVKVADLNHDGFVDAVLDNVDSNNIGVLLGAGNGNFVTAVTYAAGSAPHYLRIADFNGDGNQDVAVANNGDSTIGVFLGKGNGAFQTMTTLVGCASPYFISAADLNADSKIDIIASCTGTGGGVGVWLGTGTGAFAAVTLSQAGIGPSYFAVGDFNKDAVVDIVLSTNTNNIATFPLVGKGNGAFLRAPEFVGGNVLRSIKAFDMNGDGNMDVIAANDTGGSVSVMLGNGNGTFQAAKTTIAGTRTQYLTLGDFNQDGKMDAAVANYGSNNVTVMFNDGAGNLAVSANYNAESGPVGIQSGDLNNDGALDLVVVTLNNRVDVYLGQASGLFAAYASNAALPAYDLTVADINNDGNLDIIAGAQLSSVFLTMLGNGDGTLQGYLTHALANPASGIGVGDFNRDGAVDIVAGYNQITFGNGDGTFQAATAIGVGTSGESDAIAIGDMDNDGFQDLFLPRVNSGLWLLCRGNGDGTFQTCVSYASIMSPVSIAIADFTGDGLTDVVVGSGSGTTFQLFTRGACL